MAAYVHAFDAARRTEDRRNRLSAMYSRANSERRGGEVVGLR